MPLAFHSLRIGFFVLGFLTAISLSSRPSPLQQPLDSAIDEYLDSQTVTPVIRNVTLSDIDSILTTIIEAFRPSPVFRYIYQFADQHPHYHNYCLYENAREQITQTFQESDVAIKVITVPDETDNSERVVSFAAWQFFDSNETVASTLFHPSFLSSAFFFSRSSRSPDTDTSQETDLDHKTDSNAPIPQDHPKPHKPYNCSLALDINATRAAYVSDREDHLADKFFTPLVPFLYLALLATHPSFDGHGYAATQVRLGQQWARDRGWPVALLATPAGWPVYHGEGFRDVFNDTLVMDGDASPGESGYWEEIMIWDGDDHGQEEEGEVGL